MEVGLEHKVGIKIRNLTLSCTAYPYIYRSSERRIA